MTVLEQIEGAIAYVDTLAPRPQAQRFKQMRATLESAHNQLHQRMHRAESFIAMSPSTATSPRTNTNASNNKAEATLPPPCENNPRYATESRPFPFTTPALVYFVFLTLANLLLAGCQQLWWGQNRPGLRCAANRPQRAHLAWDGKCCATSLSSLPPD